MKFCDRCYIEYEDDEIVQFDKESPKWICLPCKWEFDHRLKIFLIEFFNSQPERSKREDFYQKLAKEYLDDKEYWETDSSEKISIECFASWLDRRCGALNFSES